MNCSGYDINVNAVSSCMGLAGLTHDMLGDPKQAAYFLEETPRALHRRVIASAIRSPSSAEPWHIRLATLHVDGVRFEQGRRRMATRAITLRERGIARAARASGGLGHFPISPAEPIVEGYSALVEKAGAGCETAATPTLPPG